MRRTSARSASGRTGTRSASARPESGDPLPPRLIGRAGRSRGHWWFDPARRWRGGPRPLSWKGTHGPEEGDWCVAEIGDDGVAFLVQVLGAEDRPAWDDAAVAAQYRLPVRFAERTESEAGAFREPGHAERIGRLDLTGELVFTIDPEDARDHDDALSVRGLPDGRHEIGIHIADVSHYVTPGTALDREARRRGTSCYLPGAVVPMLPERLSADLCSLRPDRDRLALSVFVTFDAHGGAHDVRFAETVIRSRYRLSYDEVQQSFDGERHLGEPLTAALADLRRIARGLRRRRLAAGALDLDVPEVKARVDENGAPLAMERRPHLESHELIEEFMLLANRCVGSEGTRRKSGLLYRVHERPAAPKLAELDLMLRALGLPRLGGGDDPARALQTLLAAPLDPAHRRLLHRLVLRSLARARYLERDVGHFGLAAHEYCHFTSPIRRYPDLHNHRRVREWLRGKPSAAWDPHELATLAESCTATEQNATEAEREAVKVKGLRILEGRLGDHASGIITGLIPQGFFVELDDTPVDGFVRVARELDEPFDLDAAGVRLVGRRSRRRFTLGDVVAVVVARVDVPARECDLAVAPSRPRRGGREKGRT